MFHLKLVFVAIILGSASAASVEPPFKGSDVLAEVPLIDGHNDFPRNMYLIEQNQLVNFTFNSDLRMNLKWMDVHRSFTDIPRLRQGKVGGQFWVAYVTCQRNYKDAVARTLEQIDVMKRVIKANPDDLMYVTEADQIMEAFQKKKIASMLQIEGGHSIDSRLAVLRMYYELGVRCMTLTHQCEIPWADSANVDYEKDSVKKNLTEWGKKVVYEMNRMGMIVDISHVSHGVMHDALEVTEAPIIFSHTGAFGVTPEHRNVKDDVLMKIKKNNGLVMVYFFPPHTGPSIDDVIDHIDYVKNLIGANHVGLGSDFDGMYMHPEGLEDVSKYPDLFDRLAEKKGWTKDELKKLAGLNFIRVFKDVEKIRDRMIDSLIMDDPIPFEDLLEANPNITDCRTDTNHYRKAEDLDKLLMP